MNKRLICSLLILIMGLASCAGGPISSPLAQHDSAPPASDEMETSPLRGGEQGEQPMAPPRQADVDGQTGLDRMVIYQASLQLVVQDTSQAIETARQIVQATGGYIAESNTYRQSDQLRANLTVRVPADHLVDVLAQLKTIALLVEQERLKGEDVTDQYTDLQSRLRNLRASEQQYLEIMKRADKIEDVLAVQQHLTEIRGQIEEAEGRAAYLSKSAALATIDITLTPDALARPIPSLGWRPQGTARAALEALLAALRLLADGLIWSIICILPFGLLVGLPVYLAMRWAIRRVRRRKSPTSPA